MALHHKSKNQFDREPMDKNEKFLDGKTRISYFALVKE